MIDATLAQQLKAAGLQWQPAEHDFFIMPEHNLDGQVFVVSGLPALVQRFGGQPTITFHGSIEWALDYVVLSEAVWLPTEAQLRAQLDARLDVGALMRIERLAGGYRLLVGVRGEIEEFASADPAECYARALLLMLASQ